jgi:hypothetical protein
MPPVTFPTKEKYRNAKWRRTGGVRRHTVVSWSVQSRAVADCEETNSAGGLCARNSLD